MLRYKNMRLLNYSRRRFAWLMPLRSLLSLLSLRPLLIIAALHAVLPIAAIASTVVSAGSINSINSINSNSNSAPSFTLPTQLRAQYAGVGKYGKIPLSGTGVISWQTKGAGDPSLSRQYEASLDISALFYKSTLTSQGSVNAAGIHPRRTEEKNTGKAAIIITSDPSSKQVTITGKEWVQPYDSNGQDLLTVIAQLGTFVQTQPKWRMAGEQVSFNVYRPSGIKPWRFQSQGMQTVIINGVGVPTVHVVQIPLDGAQELDEQHHFWLDPARHGFPIKLRKVKSASEYVELTLKDWQEQ